MHLKVCTTMHGCLRFMVQREQRGEAATVFKLLFLRFENTQRGLKFIMNEKTS